MTMQSYAREALSYISSPYCIDKYLISHEFFDVMCLKALVSKLLGYGIIVGSSLVKVPQVVKIAKNRSAFGLSILSILLELFSYTSLSAYSIAKGFPFSSYGEGVFITLQNFLIAFMAIWWTYSSMFGFIFSFIFTILCSVLLSPSMPLNILITLQTANVPIMLSSKILQIWTNWSNQSTGQLSSITLILFALGSTARIFTSIQETGDNLMIISCILASFCNYILIGQLYYYYYPQNVSSSIRNEKKKKK